MKILTLIDADVSIFFKAKQALRKQQTKAWKKLQQQKEQERQKEEDQRKQAEEEERRKREEEIRKIRDLSNQDGRVIFLVFLCVFTLFEAKHIV